MCGRRCAPSFARIIKGGKRPRIPLEVCFNHERGRKEGPQTPADLAGNRTPQIELPDPIDVSFWWCRASAVVRPGPCVFIQSSETKCGKDRIRMTSSYDRLLMRKRKEKRKEKDGRRTHAYTQDRIQIRLAKGPTLSFSLAYNFPDLLLRAFLIFDYNGTGSVQGLARRGRRDQLRCGFAICQAGPP